MLFVDHITILNPFLNVGYNKISFTNFNHLKNNKGNKLISRSLSS